MSSDRVCVYTSLFGQYEDLLEQPVAATSDIGFICFTDDPDLRSDSWQIRVVKPVLPTDPTRSARYLKICPHRFLPSFDVSLYIDNSVLLTSPPEVLIRALLPPETGLAISTHSSRDTVRDEFDAVVDAGYEAAWVRDEQLEHYLQSYPEVLEMKPFWSGVLVRRHLDPDVVAAMEVWWTNVLRFSRRDQLSMQVALQKVDPTYAAWALDNHDSGYWRWPSSTGRDPSRGGALPEHPDVGELQDRIAELEAEVKSRQEEQRDASVQIDGLWASEASLGRELEVLHASNETLNRRIEAILTSTSWRATAGIRAIGDLARRRGWRR